MKTLDEVIEAYEICMSDGDECTGCPYADETGEPLCIGEDKEDALHYLRAFRDAKDALEAEKDRYAEAVRNCEQAENKYRKMETDNAPLTWDELRGMEGKPVWVEANSGILRYGIIDGFFDLEGDEMIRWMTRYGYIERTKNMQGVEWQAYRKERK